MKRIFLLLLAALSFGVVACATAPTEEWPDENEIRNNSKKSHGGLRKEERKHK
jgi:hypothetical protein